jgi:hypothetical protein
MNELTRTATFAAVAGGALILAYFAAPTSARRPAEYQQNKVGEVFFADFKPSDATALRVVTYDDKKGAAKAFSVEFKNGLWAIPSHHNYPADGESRLAKTAASLIGVKREELKTVKASDQAELGVLDPLESSDSGRKGMGQRLTLKKGEEILLDLIVGKPVKGRTGYYYVRRPDEKNATYVAKLDNIDLSTKFADWIETDLLKIDKADLIELLMNNYSVDEARGRLLKGDVNELSRAKAEDPWKLTGLKGDKDEVDTARVDGVVAAIDDLKIVGVRPKPRGLSRDLKKGEGIQLNQETMLELALKGFQFTQDGELVSKHGDFTAGTNKGVVYVLRLGEAAAGDEEQLEAGLEADAKKKDGEKKEDSKKAGGSNPPRYAFITVMFDDKYLGGKPVKPEAPAKPAEQKPDAPAKEAEKKEPAKTDAAKKDDGKKEEPKKEAEKKAASAEEAKKKYDEAEAKYKDALAKYESDLKAYDEKVKAGKKIVTELNERFADWYYVIPGEAYTQLRVSRKDLVKAKSADPKTNPGAGGLNLPGGFKLPDGFKLPQKTKAPAVPEETEKSAPKTEEPAKKESEKAPAKAAEKTEAPAAKSPPEKAPAKAEAPAAKAESAKKETEKKSVPEKTAEPAPKK